MSDPSEDLRYRTSGSLVRARTIWVERPDGRRHARLRRDSCEDGRLMWRCTGGGIPDFHLEDEGDLSSFLITRPDSAPFARIRQRGAFRPRLEASDADGLLLACEVDGRLCDPDGQEVGRLEVRSAFETRLRVEPVEDTTWRSALLATPICHAIQGLQLLA